MPNSVNRRVLRVVKLEQNSRNDLQPAMTVPIEQANQLRAVSPPMVQNQRIKLVSDITQHPRLETPKGCETIVELLDGADMFNAAGRLGDFDKQALCCCDRILPMLDPAGFVAGLSWTYATCREG